MLNRPLSQCYFSNSEHVNVYYPFTNKTKYISNYCHPYNLTYLKETCSSYYAWPQKVTFPQITQKILTKDIFHCLVLITEILSFLGIYNVRKRTRTFFLTIQKIMKRINKKIYSWHKSFKSKLQIIHVTTYIALFLADFNKHFFHG